MTQDKFDLQEAAARLVQREVLCCVSSLVHTLAQGGTGILRGANKRSREMDSLVELCDQAFELASPIPDYESAAFDKGATIDDVGMWVDEDGHGEETAEAMCEWFGVEPYDREVYEHWAVSDWLADKLEAKGEKIDRDFANLTVWARTCTGQAISLDSVIEAIVRELHGQES